jgi:hypothetical protein
MEYNSSFMSGGIAGPYSAGLGQALNFELMGQTTNEMFNAMKGQRAAAILGFSNDIEREQRRIFGSDGH